MANSTSKPYFTNIYSKLAVLGLVALAGCAGPESVDDDIRRLIDFETTNVGGDSLAPELQPVAVGQDAPRKRLIAEQPPITNPNAESMSFVAADANRDVAKRLTEYGQREAVPTSLPALSGGEPAGEIMTLTLQDSFRISQRSGREFLTAQERYLLAAIRLLSERHLWGPRFFNDTAATLAGSGDSGDFQHAAQVINTLRATQRLPYGGNIEAAWIWDATEQLRQQATGRYTQSSELALRADVPLLRGAGDVAREDLIQAERNLIYEARTFERFRREYLVSISSDYFDLLRSSATILNQERQLESLRKLDDATRARADAGRLEAFQTNLTSNQVLAATASLAGLREQYILQVERFKIRLGLPISQPLVLSNELLNIPEPEVSLEEATRLALDYRLDLQNERDQLDDRERSVRNARNNLLPDLNLSGRVGVPTDPDEQEGGFKFSADDLDYSLSATLSLPLDRRIERLQLRATIIQLEQQQRDYEQQRDEVAVSVRSALRNVELARFQLTLAERQVEINRRRLRGQELQADTVEPQAIVDSNNELLDAENERDRAVTELRNAILNYLLESDQLRVARDGTLLRLPGMDTPAPIQPPVEPQPVEQPAP
jgi:outer membrane protein TolC